jgi:hypothetical protein
VAVEEQHQEDLVVVPEVMVLEVNQAINLAYQEIQVLTDLEIQVVTTQVTNQAVAEVLEAEAVLQTEVVHVLIQSQVHQ